MFVISNNLKDKQVHHMVKTFHQEWEKFQEQLEYNGFNF